MTETETRKSSYAVERLPEFIQARIAEAERVARAAELYDVEFIWSNIDDFGTAVGDEERALYLHHFAPAFVLAVCESQRRIVDRHARVRLGGGVRCHCCWTHEYDEPSWPCSTLLALALPFADHPDFCPEWAS